MNITRSYSLWLIAFLSTIIVAYYQRVTGPTYPFSGTTYLANKEVHYKLLRSHGGNSNARVEILLPDSSIHGYVEWKRFKTRNSWARASMIYEREMLSAELPHQPPAGKLQYRVILYRGDEVAIIPAEDPLVIRFKGDVPIYILVLHILAMFGSILLAARAGLEYFNGKSNLMILTNCTIGFLLGGGFVLGPIVQHYAFGAWWTGWPFGSDLTDNKTAIALLAWIFVRFAMKTSKRPVTWALAASIVTFVIFLIPHSLLGSEIDYKLPDQQSVKGDTFITR